MIQTTKRIVIVGASGHAKMVCDVLLSDGRYEIVGFVDVVYSVGIFILGFPVLGSEDDIENNIDEFKLDGYVIGIGDNLIRKRVSDKFAKKFPRLENVSGIHSSAVIGKDAEIGPGSVVMPQAVIGVSSKIGVGCVVNTSASVDHDCELQDYVSIGPKAVLGGGCRVGELSFVGIGSVILHNISIGKNSMIGGGALIVKNVGENILIKGASAKSCKHRVEGQKFL